MKIKMKGKVVSVKKELSRNLIMIEDTELRGNMLFIVDKNEPVPYIGKYVHYVADASPNDFEYNGVLTINFIKMAQQGVLVAHVH